MTTNERTDDLQERLSISRQPIPKRPADKRMQNFEETYLSLDLDTAMVEAARCIDCPSAPCMMACPVSNDIPGALKLLEAGKLDAAANVFRETSTLPAMCGRLCPHESLCEGDCVIGFAIRPSGAKEAPVAIGRLESFLADRQRDELGGYPLPELAERTGQKVAIIGSGPASITVAEELQKRGHDCTIYEAWPEAGGVLLYGIPNFKMRKEILQEKIVSLEQMGVKFVMNTRVGPDVSLEQLYYRDGFDAIFVGVGAWIGGKLDIEGEGHTEHVYMATDFLVQGNLEERQLPEHLQHTPHVGDDVVVIGGGDTSMDCVRTAIRLGAKNVTCAYRRTEAEMLGRAEERTHAVEEGVNFEYLAGPVCFIGDADGVLEAVELVRMELGEPDVSGRRRPVPIEGSEFTLPASSAIIAIGYNADADFMSETDLATDRWDLVRVNEQTHQTNVPHIFAGGDAVNRADLVVTAIADGKRAATWIHQYLRSK
ncbi:MAG TPA: NAD(P)-dependent oxidoreductase [Dehalococcoidia bacterium]|nr:NAD(P)-dependent oxidoreductase [Dehalococcoidia bacterium]